MNSLIITQENAFSDVNRQCLSHVEEVGDCLFYRGERHSLTFIDKEATPALYIDEPYSLLSMEDEDCLLSLDERHSLGYSLRKTPTLLVRIPSIGRNLERRTETLPGTREHTQPHARRRQTCRKTLKKSPSQQRGWFYSNLRSHA